MTIIDKNNGSIFYGNALLCLLDRFGYVSPIKTQLCCLIEGFTSSYVCLFFGSLKKYLEFQNLCEMFIEKGNKLPIRNVKMKWINMLFLMKRVIKLYWLVITKMHLNNAPNNSIASENLNLLYDLILILRLHDIVFLIDFMHAPIKLA